jgi:hypothetical protein
MQIVETGAAYAKGVPLAWDEERNGDEEEEQRAGSPAYR